MGLDTSHDCWSGAYSSFSRWRIALAAAAGYPPLLLMEGYLASPTDAVMAVLAPGADTAARCDCGRERVLLAYPWYDRVVAAGLAPGLPISWEPWKGDPLSKLLMHSDCDGSIASADCGPIADRLESLLPILDTYSDGGGQLGNIGAKTRTFIAGLRLAASLGEDVGFH